MRKRPADQKVSFGVNLFQTEQQYEDFNKWCDELSGGNRSVFISFCIRATIKSLEERNK